LGSTATTGYTTTSGVALRAASMITGAGGTSLSLSDYSSHVQLEKDFIPADTTFFISLTAGVPAAGSVDGSASVSVFIDWL
jgi:hypothetical protein